MDTGPQLKTGDLFLVFVLNPTRKRMINQEPELHQMSAKSGFLSVSSSPD